MDKKHAECIIFPDLHGRDFWKDAFKNDCGWDSQTYIFLGDYFDPYRDESITPGAAIRNWYELTQELKKHSEKEIIYIMGNHDAHYLNAIFRRYARGIRFSKRYCSAIRHQLLPMDLKIAFDMKFNDKKVLFTHAGITYPWYKAYQNIIGPLSADNLNKLTENDEGWLALSDVSFYRGGCQPYGSPVWADREELTEENLKDIDYDFQIVGHNQLNDDKAVFGNVIDLDCHHPFVLTSNMELEKL